MVSAIACFKQSLAIVTIYTNLGKSFNFRGVVYFFTLKNVVALI